MSENTVPEESVLTALQRLLEWPEIARSVQLSRFLDYVVRAKLRGDEGSIKAYSIAVDVFDRPADFDPQSDPIVRVQARRLRGLLAQYYATTGLGETVHIELPTGRYVPEFVFADPVTVVAPTESAVIPALPPAEEVVGAADDVAKVGGRGRREFWRSWATLGFVTFAFAAIAVTYSILGLEQERTAQTRYLVTQQTVKVMEFERLTERFDDVTLTAGLAVDLVSKLNESGVIRAVYGGVANDGQQETADFVLSGVVRRADGVVQYSAILTETDTGQVAWSKIIAPVGVAGGEMALADEVSLRVASALGAITGPVLAPVRAVIERGGIRVPPSLYLCRVLFGMYRIALEPEAAARSYRCYAQLGPELKASGEAQAAQALLIAAGVPGSGYERAALGEREAIAQQMLAQAIEAEPLNAFVWTQFARFSRERGDLEAEEMAYSTARKLNPAGSEILAAYAQALAIAGRRAEALALFDIAIDGNSNPPGWYFIAPAMVALAERDWAAVDGYAQMLGAVDNLTAPLFFVVSGVGLGKTEQVNRYLPELLETQSFRRNGIMPQLARRIGDRALLAVIREALVGAGVPSDRLDGPY